MTIFYRHPVLPRPRQGARALSLGLFLGALLALGPLHSLARIEYTRDKREPIVELIVRLAQGL